MKTTYGTGPLILMLGGSLLISSCIVLVVLLAPTTTDGKPVIAPVQSIETIEITDSMKRSGVLGTKYQLPMKSESIVVGIGPNSLVTMPKKGAKENTAPPMIVALEPGIEMGDQVIVEVTPVSLVLWGQTNICLGVKIAKVKDKLQK